MRRLLRVSLVMLAAFAAVASPSTARGGLLPVSVSVIPDGGNFRYSYSVILTSDSQLLTGDFFTIYDFAGLIAGSNSERADFTFSTSLMGPTPGRLAPIDDPGIINLTWTYSGPDIRVGKEGLGNFMVISEFGQTTDGFFTAQTHRQFDGKLDNNITSTNIPVPEAPPPVVPEPATLALVGLGLPLVGVARLIRRHPRKRQ